MGRQQGIEEKLRTQTELIIWVRCMASVVGRRAIKNPINARS